MVTDFESVKVYRKVIRDGENLWGQTPAKEASNQIAVVAARLFYRTFVSPGSDPNGTYLSFFGCPCLRMCSLAIARGFVSSG